MHIIHEEHDQWRQQHQVRHHPLRLRQSLEYHRNHEDLESSKDGGDTSREHRILAQDDQNHRTHEISISKHVIVFGHRSQPLLHKRIDKQDDALVIYHRIRQVGSVCLIIIALTHIIVKENNQWSQQR